MSNIRFDKAFSRSCLATYIKSLSNFTQIPMDVLKPHFNASARYFWYPHCQNNPYMFVIRRTTLYLRSFLKPTAKVRAHVLTARSGHICTINITRRTAQLILEKIKVQSTSPFTFSTHNDLSTNFELYLASKETTTFLTLPN